MKISRKLSTKITHLSALMTLFVVNIHYSAMCGGFCGEQDAWYLILKDYFGQGLTRNAVPVFFIISGILAFWNVTKDTWQETLLKGARKRVRTLGIPYVIWNGAAAVFFIVLQFYNTRFVPSISFSFIFQCLFNHQYNGPLWYIQKLLIYSCLAPILYQMIRNRVGFGITLIALTIQHLFKYELFPGLVFYVLGAGFALHAKGSINVPQRKITALLALAVFIITQVWRIIAFDQSIPVEVARTTIQYRLIEFIGPISLWFAVDLVPFELIPILRVEKDNFAVYVTHIMALSLVTSTMMNKLLLLPTTSPWYAVFMFFMMPLVIYLITALLAGVLKKYIPKVYHIVMGGR